ncbi:probable SDO1 Protein required for cell viability localised to cytoplasm and nucleus [Cephalotrichum gorgonifer]|uniref:Ribosome maturation protein SDO1 n=1 Tax=Cephalotrichum gorgonifer TaxID=2041049 RepID=A0AAE8MXT4_9PEZI|nr:probable SDO1 Protein required for cell viability localised to cytoplasm and nucleus [Cephalotrichum gorgonifer]
MSRQINQPSNQIKLTNVSLVRLKKGKKRFEIACYKNKVLEYRSGIETDLDEVLQIPNVFLNVSKGQTAPRDDLDKAFGKGKSVDDIVLEILKKGELQVGDKERAAQSERVHNEVVGIVASKVVDPRTKRVYTTGMIEKALDMLRTAGNETPAPAAADAETAGGEAGDKEPQPAAKPKPTWTGVVTTKSAKIQALEAMKALVAHQPIPIARARMKLRITCPTNILKQGVKGGKPSAGADDGDQQKAAGTVKDRILSYVEEVESQDIVGTSDWEVVGFFEPGAFKPLSDFIGSETKGQGRVEVLDMAVTHEDQD